MHPGLGSKRNTDIQAGPQSGDQAHPHAALGPGLPAAEDEGLAEAGPLVGLYRGPDQSHRGTVVR